MADREHVIVGTAGHIDHGKSSLVRALTGTDPDTLPEEKLRGMTIELGFVFLDDPAAEKQIVFIDVPGHEKFVRTMVAGASGVDAVMFVVAADEGISVQTREHFDILRILGVGEGFTVLTKCDLVDRVRLDEVTASVKAFLRGSFLEAGPVIPASAVTGEGLEDVRRTLREIGRRVARREDSGIFRMPIDRVFIRQGFGTVIAGTVLAGEVKTGDRVEILPEGLTARVRGIQVHREKTEASAIGRRTALNLADVKKEDLRRGQVSARPGSLMPTVRLDVSLDILPSAERELKHRDRVRLHIGTDEVMARLVLFGAGTAAPGSSVPAQIVLERPAVALPGDRFVIRTFSPLATVGGGRVLDANPERHKRSDPVVAEGLKRLAGGTKEAVAETVAQGGSGTTALAAIALRLNRSENEIREAAAALAAENRLAILGSGKEERYLPAEACRELRDGLAAAVKAYLEANIHRLGMPLADLRSEFLARGDAYSFKALLDGLVAEKTLVRREAEVSLPGYEPSLPPKEKEAADRLEGIYRRAKFAAPLEEDAERMLALPPLLFKNTVAYLVRKGVLVRLTDKVTYHRETLAEAQSLVAAHIRSRGSMTIAELRDRLDLSRKYAQALLEHFDRIGFTRRVDDKHVLKNAGG